MFECFKNLFKKKDQKKVIPEPRKTPEGDSIPRPKPEVFHTEPQNAPVKLSDLPWKYPRITKYVVDPDGGKAPLKTKGSVPAGVVLHHTVTYSLNSTVKYLQKHAVDVHFVIGKDGEVVQMVPCNRNAAHAGVSRWGGWTNLNNSFVGIEVVNIGPLTKKGVKYYDCYGNLHKGLVMERKAFGYEHWEPFTAKQEIALKALVKWLVSTYKIEPQNIVGHYECSPGRKIDPIGGMFHTMDEFRGFFE